MNSRFVTEGRTPEQVAAEFNGRGIKFQSDIARARAPPARIRNDRQGDGSPAGTHRHDLSGAATEMPYQL